MTAATVPRVRAIAYLRVSSTGQEDGYGLDVQRERVSGYAEANDVELVDVLTETASGGVRDGEVFSWEHRPVLRSIRERAGNGEFDAVIVARYDRLSRDHMTLIAFERHCLQHRVAVVSVAEQHDTNGDTAIGEFIRGQLALVAQLERAMIRDRLSAGKARARAEGKHAEGRVPFGYTSTSGTLTPHETNARIVRRIFIEARDGRTPGRISRDLNDDGISTALSSDEKPGRWDSKTVLRMLRNPVYTGEKYGMKRAHPAIISRRLFNQAQAALDARRKPR